MSMTEKSVKIEDVEAAIDEEHYWSPPGTRATVCCIRLKNGFTVIGDAHCVDDEFYDFEVGKSVARGKALQGIWAALGYQAREAIHKKTRA